MKKTIALLAVPVFTVMLAVPAKAEAIKEGQWDMTMSMQMEGVGNEAAQAMKEMENMSPEDKAMMQQMMGGMGVKMGAQGGGMGMTTSLAQCITNDNPVPQRDDQKDCTQTHTTTGNTVNFEVICPGAKSIGEITYQNESMNGVIKTESKEGNMTMNISGQYAGPCQPKVSEEVAAKGKRGLGKGAVKDAARSLLGF